MTNRITWKWIEENALPTVVEMARARGIDTEGWCLWSEMSGRAFGRRENNTARHQFAFLTSAKEADTFFTGMRFAMQQADDASKS